MKPALLPVGLASRSTADTALRVAARSWFVVAVTGQLIFGLVVATVYARGVAGGDLSAWNNTMPHAYVEGATLGNAAVAAHLLAAVVVMLVGALQLVPSVRARVPRLHRWLGRGYLVAAVGAGLSGLYMMWGRGTVGDLGQHLLMTVNAVLMLVFAALAFIEARARRFGAHRRWALRLFLVSAGVWFFRIMFMLWMLIWRRPVGFDPESFSGPALTAIGLLQYLLPLTVLEMYFRARTALERIAVASTLFVLTVATAAGIFGATLMMWIPRL